MVAGIQVPNVVEYVDTNNLCNFADLTMHVEQACLHMNLRDPSDQVQTNPTAELKLRGFERQKSLGPLLPAPCNP